MSVKSKMLDVILEFYILIACDGCSKYATNAMQFMWLVLICLFESLGFYKCAKSLKKQWFLPCICLETLGP